MLQLNQVLLHYIHSVLLPPGCTEPCTVSSKNLSFYIFMSLDDEEERKHWLKLSFSFGKNLKPNQGDAPLSKGGTHTLSAAALLFARCFFASSLHHSQLGTQGAALPRLQLSAAPHALPSIILPLPGYFSYKKPLFAQHRGTQIAQILLSCSFPEPESPPRAQSSSPLRAGVAAAPGPSCPSPTQPLVWCPQSFPWRKSFPFPLR